MASRFVNAPADAAAAAGSVPIDLPRLAADLGLPANGVEATITLLDEGNTVPFISRYRRDQTGGFDEVAVRRVAAGIARARQLAERKQTVLRTIEGQGKLTAELAAAVRSARATKELEDLYLPYKPKKQSLAEKAKQRRLEPLAREILAAEKAAMDLDQRAADFLDPDSGVASVADVLLGVGHIIAETFNARADVRRRLRGIMQSKGRLCSQRVEGEGKPLSKDEKRYRDYFNYAEQARRVPAHRMLAINRGERARVLKVRIDVPADEFQAEAETLLVPSEHPHGDFLRGCVKDAISRLIQPSLERELRRELTEQCEGHAVEVFARNLRNLFLQPPACCGCVLAIDPGFKSGCKLVVLDGCGNPLDHAVLHVVGKPERRAEAEEKIVALVEAHDVKVIAVGNGTAGRETESLVAGLVAGRLSERGLAYVVVNEAGASVYSTSPQAREEFPDHDASIRSAISIGRRLQDPLSELVKIDPASIGVGLYQHDVKARHLHASLDAVVESCVNYVGVDLNTASPSLLRYVSGLNQSIARGIGQWRAEHGPFASRGQLLQVPGFGESAYVQAAGFLKITGGENPLDATWIHPESYPIAEKVLERLGASPQALAARSPVDSLAERAASLDLDGMAGELGIGRLLLEDIIEQLLRPGRDPRDDLPRPFFKKGVLKLEDLEVGMELMGSVLNVVDFGAFVDIGLHDGGLVHISQLSSRFVRDPHHVVSVGEVVRVWVLELDKARRRVALTMIPPGSPSPARPAGRESSRAKRAERPARADRKNRTRRVESGSRRKGGRDGRVRRQAPAKPLPPISEAMREGREPLRTFGDLKQFFTAREQADSTPADSQAESSEKPPETSAEPGGEDPTAPGT